MTAPISWSIDFHELVETQRALAKMEIEAIPYVASALYGVAEEIMTASKDIVPVDTGNLKSTGHVQPPVIRGRAVEVTLGYGGTSAKGGEVGYAWYVHENEDAHHEPPTKAKFLEEPINEHMRDLDVALARALDELAKVRLGK